MNVKSFTNQLWKQLEETMRSSKQPIIQDFMRWDGMHLQQLLDEETKNERQHRSGNVGRMYPTSANTAAKILILHNIYQGSIKSTEPTAETFIIWRHSAALAQALGYYLREDLTDDWRAGAARCDYSELMK